MNSQISAVKPALRGLRLKDSDPPAIHRHWRRPPMSIRSMHLAGAVLAVAPGLTLGLPAATAQLAPNGGQYQGSARPAQKNYLTALKTITADMAKRYNARIVVDPAIFLTIQPKTPDASLTVDKAMDVLAA